MPGFLELQATRCEVESPEVRAMTKMKADIGTCESKRRLPTCNQFSSYKTQYYANHLPLIKRF
jgi:hypothetical protein